jgi:hypothetical protein
MADTDLPGMGGLPSASPPTPRPIASPFGALPGLQAWAPPQQPGFNFNPGTASPAGWLPDDVAKLLAQITPSGEDLKRGVADTLGAPVDMAGWALHMMGVPISGDQYYGGGGFNRSKLVAGEPTWTPGPSVPLSSANIRGMLDNPPPLDAFLQAMRRYGKF